MAIDPNNLAVTANLTFSDEFNSLSLANGSSGTWSTSYSFNGYNVQTLSGNQELEYYINANDPNTASVKPWTISDGVLTISANPADEAIKPYIGNYNYTSGLLTSQTSFSQTYGYFEINARLPDGQGLWPAFWLMPSNGSWRPEIDVFEVLGSDPSTLWQFSHPADTSYDRYFMTQGTDLSADFHRIGVDWQKDQITFYFDGKVTGIAPTPPEMNVPMYMLLNLAVGGSWGGAPDATTTWPANLQVDYIRVYEARTGAPSGSDASGDGTLVGTSGDDVFTLSALREQTFLSYDAAGSDVMAVPVDEAGFRLAGYTGQSALTMTDAGAWWNNISGAQVIRWTGAADAVDSVSKVDGLLQAMPGNQGGGVLFIGYTADHKVGLYYDSDPAHAGRASLVATFDNLTDAMALTSADFKPGSGSAPPAPPAPSLSIGPATISHAEGAAGATTAYAFTVTRSGDLSAASSANWSVSGSGSNPAFPADFSGGVLPSGTVAFAAGQATATVTVSVSGDGVVEQDEGFTVSLSAPTGATVATATAAAVIVNDDTAAASSPSIGIGPASVSHSEGAAGASTAYAYTVTRTGDLSGTSSANWAVTGSGANAASASDFSGGALPGGTVNFAAGQSSATVTINVAGDSVVESDEGFTVTLFNPTRGVLGTATAAGVIVNDDAAAAAPSLALGPASVSHAEGAAGASTAYAYTVTRTGDLSGTSSANWAVSGSGANAASASDFNGGVLPSGTVNFAAGQSSATVTISVSGDGAVESDEGFTVTLSNPTRGVLGTATATGVIVNDDAAAAAPSLALGPASVSHAEGAAGASTAYAYTVTRTGDLSGTSSANWAVSGSGANAASAADFNGGVLPSGTVNFAAGQSSATLTVSVAGDSAVEPDEGFTVTLSNPTRGVLGTATAAGVIVNDDAAAAAPSLALGPASVSHAEGGAGATTAFVYTVTRSGDLSAVSSADWAVSGSGANGTTAADFSGGVLPSGTVSFAAGQSTATLAVNVAGDAAVEADEAFTVTLSGAKGASLGTATAGGLVTNDDAAAAPSLSLGPNSVSQAEGAAGATTAFTYTVTRSGDLSAASSANWAVTGSGANAATAADFSGGVLPTGRVAFAAGQSTATLTVNVAGDSVVEPSEGFTVTLSSPTGATLGSSTAAGLITNDDVAAGGSGGVQSGPTMTGTAGDDVFMLPSSGSSTIFNYDAAGSDQLGVSTSAFSLAGMTAGQTTLNVIDVSAWWNNISNAQVLRWHGDPSVMDSVSDVDAVLQSMPGNQGGGVLVAAYAPDHTLALYYDSDAAHAGGARLVATLMGQTDPDVLGPGDFRVVG